MNTQPEAREWEGDFDMTNTVSDLAKEIVLSLSKHSSNCSQSSWAGYGEINPPKERCFCGYYDVFNRDVEDFSKKIDALLTQTRQQVNQEWRERIELYFGSRPIGDKRFDIRDDLLKGAK